MPEHIPAELPVATFTDVYQQHAQDPQTNPDLLAHMQRLSAAERQSEQELVAVAAGHAAAEARPAISTEHHQEHVDMARAAGVADIGERPEGEQNLIGEVLEIGDTAIQDADEAPLPQTEVSPAVQMTLRILNHSINQLPAIRSRQNFDAMRTDIGELLNSISYEQMTLVGNFDLVEACLRMDAAVEAHGDPDIRTETGATLAMLNKMQAKSYDIATLYHNDYLGPRIKDRLLATPLTTASAIDMGRIVEQAGAPADDAVLEYLETSDHAAAAALGALEARYFDVTQQEDEQTINDFEGDASLTIRDVLRSEFKLKPSMMREMGRAMSARLHWGPTQDKNCYNMYSVSRSFKRMGEVVESVPSETIQRLHNELGVLNLDMYTPDNLRDMTALLDGDPAYIDHLKAGDTTVVFVDARGDHNGALTDVLQNYSNGSGRTLLFEVSKPSDFYRRMIMLKKLGVKPSTLVVAAHGSPGKTHFGRPKDDFTLEAHDPVWTPGMEDRPLYLEDSALGRLASDEFMQPSRGIDDPDERIGRRSIIFNSCSSDAAFNETLPSTVESVVRTISRSDVDAYGASSPAYIDREGEALSFRGNRDPSDPKSELVPNGSKVSLVEPEPVPVRRSLLERLKARRTREMDENRRLAIKRSEFETIILSKQAKKEPAA